MLWKRALHACLFEMTMKFLFTRLFCATQFSLYKVSQGFVSTVQCFHLSSLQEKIGFLSYCQSWRDIDGELIWKEYDCNNPLDYHAQLSSAICLDFTAADRYICESGRHWATLKKQNTHRALELCVLIKIMYDLAQNVSKLAIKLVQSKLKGWLENNAFQLKSQCCLDFTR